MQSAPFVEGRVEGVEEVLGGLAVGRLLGLVHLLALLEDCHLLLDLGFLVCLGLQLVLQFLYYSVEGVDDFTFFFDLFE